MVRQNLCAASLAFVCLVAGGCSGHKSNVAAQTNNSAEPDKVLYERALNDIKRGRHEVGRLSMQTLINTYPDSEYLAKAKLAIADSYLKEGGIANLTQAIAGYKDFIVFFPFLPEAAYAQMQVGMAHFKQMEKPDRDRSHAKDAQDEFQTFLQKYPNDPLVPQAEQRLREVQEMLAEGDFRIGRYYYLRPEGFAYRAAASRLLDVVNRYPLYSKSDQALWMLGSMVEKTGKGEQKEQAAKFYAQIVRNYPLSDLVPDAKKKLTALHTPIPQPDPQALAWMQKEREFDRGHAGMFHKVTGAMKSGPDVRTAARTGPPNLTPASETASGVDTLRPGGTTGMGGGAGSNTAVIETVTPGASPNAAAGSSTNGSTSAENPAPSGGASAATETPAANGPDSASPSPGAASTAGSDPANGGKPGGDQANGQQSTTPANNGNDTTNESSSKKKKGLRKIIPW
jgi:outer membrane protein assembly factor BamD